PVGVAHHQPRTEVRSDDRTERSGSREARQQVTTLRVEELRPEPVISNEKTCGIDRPTEPDRRVARGPGGAPEHTAGHRIQEDDASGGHPRDSRRVKAESHSKLAVDSLERNLPLLS